MKWPGERIVQIICCCGTFKWWPQLPYLRLDATNIDFVHEFYVIFRSKRLSFVDCFVDVFVISVSNPNVDTVILV